jgi:hypothetical protein
LAKTVTAFYAGRHQVVRMAPVTTYFFKGKARNLRPQFQFLYIVCLMGEIAGAITPDGHPKSPTYGHLKIPHPPAPISH